MDEYLRTSADIKTIEPIKSKVVYYNNRKKKLKVVTIKKFTKN